MNAMKQIPVDEIEWTLRCEPEDVAIEGNAMASGDDAVDQECYQWIRDQLDSGNLWAWCWVSLEARWNGLTSRESLGGCSYKSREDFIANSMYYDDMRAECIRQLNEQAQAIVEGLDA